MAGVNKAILIGNLGKDPDLDHTTSGVARCRFSLATSEKWTDKSGESQERTDWHNIVIWSKLAEIAGKYLKKGATVYIEGPIRNRQYQDRDGATKYITEVIASQMQMLGGKSGERSQAPDPEPPYDPKATELPPDNSGAPQGTDDDLPF